LLGILKTFDFTDFFLKMKTFDIKETQTDELVNEATVKLSDLTTTEDSVMNNTSMNSQDKTMIEDLRLNLKIKENLIESINDTMVLKEAEIARLKTRIGLMERKKLMSELNSESLDDHHKI
jgi:hypothetical protein